ncbi:MAG: O-antigen ligase family protein, partial [Candidatus Hydrogenedentes bacterium]|nr:O-antigen ligase family protein [Candidatus Hydrogenedentota bacterium]
MNTIGQIESRTGLNAPVRGLIAVLALGVALVVLAAGHYALLGILGLVTFWLFLRSPVLGLYLTTALLLLSGASGVLGFIGAATPVTAAKICGVMTLLAWLVNTLVQRSRPLICWEMVLALIFLLWAAFGILYSRTSEEQLPEWIRLSTVIAYFIMAAHLLNSSDRIHRFVVLLALCGMLMAAFAVYQYFTPSTHLEPTTALEKIGAGVEGAYIEPEALQSGQAVRVSGRAGHSNWLALALLLILPLNAYWFRATAKASIRVLIFVAVGLETMAIVFTFTRTGLVVGGTLAVLLVGKRLMRLGPYRAAGLAVALLLAWFLLPPAYKERVLSLQQYMSSESVEHRTELQAAAFQFMLDHPVQGVGLGGFGFRLIETQGPVATVMRWLYNDLHWNPLFFGTHNMYLQLGCESGLVGLAIFLVLAAVFLRRLNQTRRAAREVEDRTVADLTGALQVSMWSFLISAIFLHALQQKIWWMILALGV